MIEYKVLIVEDRDMDANFLRETFSKIGIDVTVATSGMAALKIISKESFNLYWLDKMLPGMDGTALSYKIREAKISERIVINTILEPTIADVIAGEQNHVSVFMQKTYNELVVYQAVLLAINLPGELGAVFLKAFSDEVTKCLIPLIVDGRHSFYEIVSILRDSSVCLSSQTGCLMDCGFCATGKKLNQYVRPLTFEEMYLGYNVAKILHGRKQTIDVLQEGMGEPLLNQTEVTTLAERLDDGDTMRISTMVPALRLFENFLRTIEEDSQVRNRVSQIQFSLHFPNDTLRCEHMPGTKKTKIVDVLDLLERFAERTGIDSCSNYVIFSGINDSPQCIAELASLHMNRRHLSLRLAVANPLGIYQPVSMDRMHHIRRDIITDGVDERRVKDIFVSSGSEIGAACGQLAGSVACDYGARYEMY